MPVVEPAGWGPKIKGLYGIRDEAQVFGFLETHLFLIDLLKEAHPWLQKHFPTSGSRATLGLGSGTLGIVDDGLVLFVATNLNPIEAFKRRQQFDADWWRASMGRAKGKLHVRMEFPDVTGAPAWLQPTTGALDSFSLQTFRSWLEDREWQQEKLIDWMQGYEIPVLTAEDDPEYLCLLRALPNGEQRSKLAHELASRVGWILEARPDEQRPGRRPEQVLYNLLMLAGTLRCPEELAWPLQQMLDRGKLEGEWQGINLVRCLRAAIQANRPEPEEESRPWRGVFAPKYRRNVLFSVPVQLRTASLPRRKPNTGIDLRRLARDEDG